MVFQLQLDKRETEARARAVRTALSDYLSQNSARTASGSRQGPGGDSGRPTGDASVVPQLSESFLDRLEKMSVQAQKGEMEYRRKLTNQALQETRQAAIYDKELAYYEDLEKSLQSMGNRSGGSPELIAMVSPRTVRAFDAIEKATNQVAAIYKELSAQNLNPSARLYVVTSPYSEHVQRAISVNRLAMSFLFVLLLTLAVAVAGALVYHSARSSAGARAESPTARV
jgi:hypothetical protein